MTIGQRIKQLRESKGWSQKELAYKLELRQSTVSSWETNICGPNPTQRKKLCEVFGISEAELFGEIRPIEIKENLIPIVSSVGATDERGRAAFESFEPPYKAIDFKNCKAVVVDSNSMAPLAYKGQKIIYSEIEPICNGDLVFIQLKDGDQLFKRYFKIALQPINVTDIYEPIVVKEKEIEFIYKVVGVRF